jgi:hypothetical protein
MLNILDAVYEVPVSGDNLASESTLPEMATLFVAPIEVGSIGAGYSLHKLGKVF